MSAGSDEEYFVEARGVQSGGGPAPSEFGDGTGVGGVHAAGLIQSCGVEHRRALSAQ
jgi:hypothetical protein